MNHRLLCWDASLIEKNDGISIVMNKPEKKNIALMGDCEWEGVHNGYAAVVQTKDCLRLYYRADATRQKIVYDNVEGIHGVICVAESRDGGITFRKPNIGKYEYSYSLLTFAF